MGLRIFRNQTHFFMKFQISRPWSGFKTSVRVLHNTFKFNMESWILEHKLFGTLLTCLHQDQEQNSQSGTSRVIQTPTKDYKDMRVLCLFKFNVESSIWEHRLFGTLLTRPYHHQEPKPQSKPPESSTSPTKYFEDMRVLCPLNSM